MSVEFVDGERDSIEDLEEAKKAITLELVKGAANPTPALIHFGVVIRALDELIMIRKHIMSKRKDRTV